jgi:hypothetical protein
MTRLRHDRYCAEIVAQAELLRSHVKGADLDTPVPSCPGWTRPPSGWSTSPATASSGA